MSYSRRSRYSLSPSPYRRDSRSISRSRSRSRSRSSSRDVENPGNNLYVTGLSPRITKKELEKHFAAEGTVIDVHLVVDPLTRESRGFGFVTMSTVKEADRCIKYLDRSVLEGRVITVEKAKRRRGRTPTPGRYLGLRTIRGGGGGGFLVIRLDDLLATLLIGGAGAGRHVIHLNVAGADPTPLTTTDGGHILLTIIAVDGPTPELDPHTVGPLPAGVTGPPHLTTRGIAHQMTDTIGGLREAQGGAIQEAFPLDQGGAIPPVFPLHRGGAQGEVIREACRQGQGRTQGLDILETATLGAAAVQVLLPDRFICPPLARVLHLVESRLSSV
uniref:RRM domain-containing protein n=1 Tax=Salix viminalis TaxID=40686 RepID=A0A6N2MJS3_SALVM